MRTYIPYIFFSIIILIDVYYFFKLRQLFSETKNGKRFLKIYFLLTALLYVFIVLMFIIGYRDWSGWTKNYLLGTAQSFFLAKFFALPLFLIGDVVRFFSKWMDGNDKDIQQKNGMSRLTFFYKSALLVGGSFFGGFLYGILRGAYQIKTNYIKLKIKDLPEPLKQLKIVQISDLHVGSYANTNHLENMVNKINQEKPDYIFFTGDLVNFKSEELLPYLSTLKKMKANRRIYSILGNHDYGEYYKWDNELEQQANFQQLLDFQQELGWRLLRDEHELLDYNNHQIAIIGIEYWGHSMHFGQKGNLAKAFKGAEEADLHLLLSHDPSHWDKEVSINQQFKQIDVTFSGHTHGFQFGIELPKLNIKWSPSKYIYPHWAGLYEAQEQKLYVNRGMGFVAYPGRLGIPPEISVFSFESA